MLNGLGVRADTARTQVRRIVGAGEEMTSGAIPFTPETLRSLRTALREALSLERREIGTEHLLLALVKGEETVATRVLAALDVHGAQVREAIAQEAGTPAEEIDRAREGKDESEVADFLQAEEPGAQATGGWTTDLRHRHTDWSQDVAQFHLATRRLNHSSLGRTAEEIEVARIQLAKSAYVLAEVPDDVRSPLLDEPRLTAALEHAAGALRAVREELESAFGRSPDP